MTGVVVHKFGITCPSETYFNTETIPTDANLEIPGYKTFRSDHPSNYKREPSQQFYVTIILL